MIRKKFSAVLMVTVLALAFTSGACNKQKKCGCDGETKFDLTEVPGRIYYEEETKYTYFISDGIYSYFTLCNTEEMWDKIKKFKPEEHVLVSGSVADDCMKQVSAYAYNQYVIHMTEIKRPPFKK